jgi:hypothetical protein
MIMMKLILTILLFTRLMKMVSNLWLIKIESEAASEYGSEEEEEEAEEDDAVMKLEVNIGNGSMAKLVIVNEENFEEEVLKFCQDHSLDDYKRKKLMKLVKTQLIQMFEDGELSSFRGLNEYEDEIDNNN